MTFATHGILIRLQSSIAATAPIRSSDALISCNSSTVASLNFDCDIGQVPSQVDRGYASAPVQDYRQKFVMDSDFTRF